MSAIALVDAPLSQPLTVVAAESDAPGRRRLAELGIRPGAVVSLLHRTAGGGRVLAVSGSRIALGRDLLAALYVCPTHATCRPDCCGTAHATPDVPEGAVRLPLAAGDR